MTVLEDEGDYYQPLYIRENRGWTDQEAKNFIKEVERLKELWYPTVINSPEVSTKRPLQALKTLMIMPVPESKVKIKSVTKRTNVGNKNAYVRLRKRIKI